MWLRTTKKLTSFFPFLLLCLPHKTCSLILKCFLCGGKDFPKWRPLWPLLQDSFSSPTQPRLSSPFTLLSASHTLQNSHTHTPSDFPPPQWHKLCKPFINHILAVWERTQQPSHSPAMQLGSHLFNTLLGCCLHKNKTTWGNREHRPLIFSNSFVSYDPVWISCSIFSPSPPCPTCLQYN